MSRGTPLIRTSCSSTKRGFAAAVLLPMVYLGEILAGVIALAAGRDRQARVLLLGMLLFCGVVLVILAAFAGKWMSTLRS
jgi:hypothetical protein